MKKIIFIFCLLFNSALVAQSNILNAKDPSEIGIKNFDQPQSDADSSFLEYNFIDDRDILWSKIVYEKIDLNEKLNFPLLFPIVDSEDRTRKSLWRILKENIENGNIKKVYDSRSADFLKSNEIVKQDSIIEIYSSKYVAGDSKPKQYAESKDIKAYYIKGMWYFDKRQSEMKYRLLGLMPYGNNLKEKDKEQSYFWIWYPSIREILHKEKVFNDKSNANRISFDQLLVARRFSSYIYKEDNVYGNREIKEYKKPGLESILESERIKKEILDFEQDMWNR
jgi:gliding motility associated protien GldN